MRLCIGGLLVSLALVGGGCGESDKDHARDQAQAFISALRAKQLNTACKYVAHDCFSEEGNCIATGCDEQKIRSVAFSDERMNVRLSGEGGTLQLAKIKGKWLLDDY